MEELNTVLPPVRKILCVISIVRPNAGMETYTAPDGAQIPGLQTNEAPVKYLLSQLAPGAEAEIICVVSPEAQAPVQILGEEISALDYFCREVLAFDNGQHTVRFTPVQQDSAQPQNALTVIADLLCPQDIVDIDTTGGNRDGIALMMLVAQLMEYKHVRLGSTVYSNYLARQIQYQDETYRLMELISALNAFTSNGKSDQIAAFFRSSQVSQVKQLLGSMERFSNDIAFCRTTKIAESVRHVNIRLSLFEQMEQDQLNTFAERMFQKLLPSLRDQFVATDEDENAMNLNLIQWCSDRGLVMQALALFREFYPRCIRDYGLMDFAPDFLESCQPDRFRLTDAALFTEALNQTTAGYANRQPGFSYRGLNVDVIEHPFSAIDSGKVDFCIPEEDAANLLFFFYQIRILRNRTFHPGEEKRDSFRFLQDNRQRLDRHAEKLAQACTARYVKKDLDNLKTESVNTYLRRAIAALQQARENKSRLPQNH